MHHVRVTGRAAALAFIKNIVEPGLVWVSLYALGYRNPLLGEAVVTTALPILVTVAMLAVRYQVAEAELLPLFIGMGSSLLTVAGFIALTGAVAARRQRSGDERAGVRRSRSNGRCVCA